MSNVSRANNTSGGGKKSTTSGGTIVKSRYMQAAEKTSLSKSTSLTNESMTLPLKPCSPKPSGLKTKFGTPPRRSIAPQAASRATGPQEAETTLLRKSILQSTFSDGHFIQPDFDISVIRDKTVFESAAETDKNAETDKEHIEMMTFLLAHLTAKMENNLGKLKADAEARILQVIEEEETLRKEVHKKKCQYLSIVTEERINKCLDMQIDALTPIAEAVQEFTKDYTTFAAAVDTTRHELPVKNFYIDKDGREFLDKAEACLKEKEELLLECTEGTYEDNRTSLECLREIKTTSKDISQHLSRAFSELHELSSLVCQHTVYAQQSMEEEKLGPTRLHELYWEKK